MHWSCPIPLLGLLIVGCGDKDTSLADADADGHTDDMDCDDADATVNPDAEEVCDGIDNDCDGLIDDDDDSLDPTTSSTFYADADGDAYGDDASPIDACSQPPGHAAEGGDCDETDGTVYPGAPALCDGQHNDCSDVIDAAGAAPESESDADGDGYVPCSDWVGDSTMAGGDCDDTDDTLNPGAAEVCDGIDNDCDGLIDDDDTLDPAAGSTFYADADGDTYGDAASAANACLQPAGSVTDDQDCDDTDATVNPDAVEVPRDGTDSNCDGDDDCADLSCDGHTDLYVSSLRAGSYDTIFIGDGTSLTADTTLTGCQTYDTAVGDVNGDGYVDLVHAPYYCTTNQSLFYGSPTGFTSTDGASFSGPNSLKVEVTDLNHDGYDDIACTPFFGSSGYIYWGSADGVTEPTTLSANEGRDLATGDANGDGHTDIVFCSHNAEDSHLYYGSTAGYSDADYDLIEGIFSYSCRMEDLDSDGYDELILGGSFSYDVHIYWGSSAGYSTANRSDLTSTNNYTTGVTTGDYNADGYRDIVFSSNGSSPSLLYYGSASGYSDEDAQEVSTYYAFRSVSADLNEDGYDDLVAPSAYSDGLVFLGSASGLSATADYALPIDLARNVSTTDLDGDGYWEIAFSSNSAIDLFWGSGAGWSDKDHDSLIGVNQPFAAPLFVGPGESAHSD